MAESTLLPTDSFKPGADRGKSKETREGAPSGDAEISGLIARLNESESKYRTLVESMVDGVFVIQDEMIRYANPFMAHILGYEIEDLRGLNIFTIVAPEDRAWALELYRDLLAGEQIQSHYELKALHRDGRTRIFVRIALALIEFEGRPAILGTARDITEQKRALALLKEREEKFRRITENMRDVVCELDEMGRICYASPSYRQVLGYEPADLIGQSPIARFHPDDVEPVLEAFRASLESGKPVNAVLRYRHAEGYYLWLQSSGNFLFDGQGKITGAVISSRNITERKHYEEALLEKQRYINLTLEGTDEGLWEWEIETGLLRVDDHSIKSLGYDPPNRELSLDLWFSLLHPSSIPAYMQAISDYFENRKKYYEVELQIRVGEEWRWIWTRGILVHGPDGLPAKMIGTYRDISERKTAEKALRKSEERFRSLAESTSDWIWETDAEGRYTFVSPNVEGLLGYGPQEIIGRRPFQFMPPEEGKRISRLLRVARDAEKPFSGVEKVHLHKDGRRLVFEACGIPILDSDGEFLGYRGIDRDITRRKALEAQAIRVRHLSSIGELAGGVAHEINNPVTGIINYAQILADEAAEKGADAEIPLRIIKEGERIARIVKNLLSFAREGNTDKEPLQVLPTLEDAIALMGTLFRKEGISVKVELSDRLPMVVGNRKDMQQVFLNILTNSRYALNRKYKSSHKEKLIRITGEERTPEEMVRLVFLDNGIGISPEVLSRIFDPFFSTKPPDQAMGLGLSITYGIIKDHRGNIDIDSQEGEYTKVILEFPAAKLV
jgi:PAS domain S-box-containing protein